MSAARWRRLLAFLFDGIILGLIGTVPAMFLGQMSAGLGPWGHLLLVPAMTLYRGIFQGGWGATPGQRLLGLRVVAVGGGRLGWGRALLRSGVLSLGLGAMGMPMPGHSWEEVGVRLVAGLFGFGSLYLAFFEPGRRGVHDLLAMTLVVLKDTKVSTFPLERRHAAVLLLLGLGAAALSVPSTSRSSIQGLQSQLSADPRIRNLQLWEETLESHGQTGGMLRLEGWWVGEPAQVSSWMEEVEKEVRAAKISGIEVLAVDMTSGWDVGFASATTRHQRVVPLFAREQKEGVPAAEEEPDPLPQLP